MLLSSLLSSSSSTRSRRGFAGMSLFKRKGASARGGLKAHRNTKEKRCHEWCSESAREAANKRWAEVRERKLVLAERLGMSQ